MFDHPPQSRVSAPGVGVADFDRPDGGDASHASFVWMVLFVGACFALYGMWRAPVPGVNEPHYLSKARHFWDPEWCPRDLFLQSANAHWVFYATVGSLTRVLTLEQTAWVGRGLAWGALAIGWVAMARQVVPGPWGAFWGAPFFLALTATGNLSGEWLIGGVEAKGFAYAALFMALAAAGRFRWRAAAAWCGIAVSFHPVVGVWGALALAFACVWMWLEQSDTACPGGSHRDSSSAERAEFRPPLRILLPMLVFTLVSLPGLIPACALLFNGAGADVKRAADEYQVFQRLAHHLDPMRFKTGGWVMYGTLLAAWLAARPWKTQIAAERTLFRFVVGTLLIGVAGMVVGFGPRWAGVLKFYPFRLADLFLPIAVALAAARWMEARVEDLVLQFSDAGQTTVRSFWWQLGGHAVALLAFVWALAAPGTDRNPTGWTAKQRADWLDVCRWISEHTPDDALCLTPRFKNYTFKWYAGRAEYAIWKDCPQDAAGLVEWQRRLDLVRRWRGRHYESGYNERAIGELREATGIDFIVDWYVQPYRIPPRYRNDSFRVYRLADFPALLH